MKMCYHLLILFAFVSFTVSGQGNFPLESGRWHAEIQLNDSVNLPFVLIVAGKSISIENASENIVMDVTSFNDDSVAARFPLYDAEIRMASLRQIATGEFINHAKTNNNIYYFRAIKDPSFRCFMNPEKTTASLSGRWELQFDHEEGIDKLNVAILKQEGNRVTGSVLTATGDHRYLDGELSGNHLQLSTFNGAFAMLYDGYMQKDGSLKGKFYSGHTGFDTWSAIRKETASLPDASTITGMKPGFSKVDFSFPDLNGKIISMHDTCFSNKVVVVQIMGTWCPNCLDESVFLNKYLAANHIKGFEVVALDYERTADTDKIRANIKRVKDRLQLNYPILYAGNANRDSSSASLPMLSRIAAYPTSIIIDRKGNVRKIHTGFSGPATGIEYLNYTKEFDVLVEELLKEGK